MLTSVTICGFRSFQSLHVKPLSRVNLFVGANNAGKTSLLEAIELLVQGTPTALWRGPSRRGEEIIQGSEEDRPILPELDLSHLFFGHSLQNSTFSIEGDDTPPRYVKCQVLARIIHERTTHAASGGRGGGPGGGVL
jgi:AAA15 family ATPase/GTPase